MKWFKHDADAASDAKVKKLLLKYGATGYAIYFHCLELIASDVAETNITFELEHDAEIIADNLKIKGTSEQGGIDVVNEVMRYMVSLGLFENHDGRISCFKMMKRLDASMTSNPSLRKQITGAKQHHDSVMTQSCQKRIEEKRIEEKRATKATHETGVPINDTTYQSLLSDYGKSTTDGYIQRVADYCAAHGKKYKDYSAAARNWMRRDEQEGKLQRRVKVKRPERVYGGLPDASE